MLGNRPAHRVYFALVAMIEEAANDEVFIMTTIRQQRLAGLLYEELSILISSELEDPLVSLAQVTHVVVSKDLRNVRVYVSHDDVEVSKEQVLLGLKRATPFLRREIATRCTMRAVPELSFSYDDTPQRASRVDELLRKIAAERQPSDDAGAGEAENSGETDTGVSKSNLSESTISESTESNNTETSMGKA